MIFGNHNEFNFESFKDDVNSAADPLVEAVSKYDPNKKHRTSYKSPVADLPESAALFFRAAADALDSKGIKADTGDDNAKAQSLQLDKLGKQANDTKNDISKKTGNFFSKAGDSAGKTVKSVQDAKLDKKLGLLGDNVNSTIKDAKLDKKFGDVVGTVGEAVMGAASSLGGTIKDAKLDKKAGDVFDNMTTAVKDAKLDKKASDVADTVAPLVANVAESVGTAAVNALDAVSSFIKDNKLDKKAADMADTAGQTLSDVGDRAGKAIKDAKLDKKLAQAELPEKLLTAANVLPGVTIKNPGKAAKQFRKNRTLALKAARKQQKSLAKLLAVKQKEAGKRLSPYQKEAGKMLAGKQKDAQKYIQARQKDIQTGKIQLPFVQPKKKSNGWTRLGLYLGGAGLAYGGLSVNNARIWNAIPPLESKLAGDSRYFNSRQGLIFYKEAGQDQENKAPVVFVHGIGAGNHSYEWLQNFEAFSKQHKVYAFDLLGFGNSAKPNIKYTTEVYIKQLTEFLDEVVGRPAHIVASSLSAGYAVQVAYRRPELVQKLLLVSPTGINKQGGKPAVQMLPGAAYYLLRLPVLGKALYSLIAGRADIQHFAESQMFFDKNMVTKEMVEQYYTAGHQPGADFAPPSFFTGLLDAEIGQTLGKLDKPVMMVYGKDSKITPVWEAEALEKQNPTARLEFFENARMLVQWEKADKFNWLGLEFLSQPFQPTKPVTASTKAGASLGQTGHIERKSTDQPNPVQKVAGKVDDSANKIKEAADKLADEFKNDAAKAAKAVDEHMGKQAQDADLKKADKPQAETKPVPTSASAPAKAADPKASTSQQPRFANPQQGQNDDLSKTMGQFSQQAGSAKTPETDMSPEPAEYAGDHDLKKELKEHREAFIGDNETGAALLQDKDKNDIDDRRMGPPQG